MVLQKDVKLLCPHCGWWNPAGIMTGKTPTVFYCFRCGKNVPSVQQSGAAAASGGRLVSKAIITSPDPSVSRKPIQRSAARPAEKLPYRPSFWITLCVSALLVVGFIIWLVAMTAARHH